jgi:hypothetical protein
MVGNTQADISGNIYVELDENNIIVVDPNKTTDDFGNIRERLVDHENLVMYANLEADVLPRTKLSVGGSPNDRIKTISVAKMNFLKPTKNSYLGTGYYDELTGENTTQFKGENQKAAIAQPATDRSDPYILDTVVNQKDVFDNGLLGITSINIKTSSSFIPSVDILLEDVQGKGLFQLGNNSPYSAFFNLPYPQFYLTLKGYYGQAIRYQLNLKTFHASFNGFSGNYQVRLNFVGYKFNILNEVAMGHLLATPHMYSQRFDVTQTVDGPQQSNKAAESQANTQAERGANNLGSNEAVVTQLVAEKGYQKILEVYSEYKAKGLIAPDFPELTLVQLMNKLETFEQLIADSFDTSWFNRNLNPKPIVLKTGQKLYIFKDLSKEAKETAISQLQGDIIKFNDVLANNSTLGSKGAAPIPNPIKYDMIETTAPVFSEVNWRETTRIQTGIANPSAVDETQTKINLTKFFVPTSIELPKTPSGIIETLELLAKGTLVKEKWFVFEDERRFDKEIASLETQANKYMKGLTQKFQNPTAPPPLDNERDTSIIKEIKFFYEIWERQFLTSHYSGFIRANTNQINELITLNIEAEANNIISKLGISSPYLTLKLRNFNLNAQDYPEFLRTISNSGTGRAYQDFIRDFFVTPYIKRITENSFSILSTLDLGKIPQTATKSEALRSLVVNAPNDPLIVDTLPYTDQTWCLNNLNQGNSALSNQVYNTNKSLTIFEPRRIIANFTDVYNYTTNRPVTNFSYILNQNPTGTIDTTGLSTYTTYGPLGLNAFYLNRNPQDFVATEGYINGTTPTRAFSPRSTTSMLNTPYFINAVQNGVYNSRLSGITYPYVQAAYMFLNSLPLATLREKYKSVSNNVTTDLDYISSTFKKFGAIHKLPYAWILKYGSIWHRYKKYKESNVDILESAWKNFDYAGNYYPVTSAVTETYEFKYSNVDTKITLQSEGVTQIQMQVGFYPKVINDFNVFLNGYDLYENYTSEEIQQSVNSGMKLYNFSSSNINSAKQGDKNLRLTTWSILLPNITIRPPVDCNPKDNTVGDDYFVIPSFGTPFNQTVDSCLSAQTTSPATVVNLTNNPNMYNGSVRCLWSAPNYGYFNSNQLAFPEPDSYLTSITTGNSQTPLYFLTQDNYTKIEEVFSVFEKKILDSFETEFLNFCKPIGNASTGRNIVTFGQSPVDPNATFKNFQSLFRSLMVVPAKTKTETDELYFNNVIDNQYSLFQNGIKSFMEYDVIFKYGNPSNYERRIFDSYLSHNNTQEVVDPITFEPYVPNSLPSAGGNLTLSQSQINNIQAWTALETEVGFSTIPNVRYSSIGSYITDFFIDNNIAFTSDNVTLLAPIIKMYATQKLNNPNLNAIQFQNQLSQYLNRETLIQNNFLNGVLSRLRKDLPDQVQLPERVINSVISGDQSKVENYEVFKALNDKWIAGGDWKTKTLFEDMLFLDRASRNIGDSILLDIFDLKYMFGVGGKTAGDFSLNQAMSVFTFISGILIKNNFVVMPLPAYVNFYNIQDVDVSATPKLDRPEQFANNLWGTFLDVDYRNSGPKMVCFYAGKPSQYLKLPKGDFKYRDDAFEMRRASGNPLLEDQQGKKDWALSNKCVGFNVDVGIRNQNIFYSMTVSQDNGVATSESINVQLDMANQASGRQIATQNNSLYNLYKNRSYKCSITSLGNALIQPTMYFNLRHVPMFDGPYLITEVNHSIQQGSFQTTFDGTRQGYFDLPTIDSFLQSINQNLITKLEEILKINKDQVKISATTDNEKSNEVVQQADNTKDTTNSCSSKITDPVYVNGGYEAVDATLTEMTPQVFAEALKRLIPNNVDLQVAIYAISYIRTYQEASDTGAGMFNGWNNNFATLSLTQDWFGQVSLLEKKYSCINVRTNPGNASSEPIAHFSSLDKYIQFMAGRLRSNLDRIIRLGLTKYYVCHWPVDNISEEYYNKNEDEFLQTKETINKALTSAAESGLKTKNEILKDIENNDKNGNQEQTPTVTQTVGQTCPPPVLSTFSPSAGFTGTIVQVNGRNFESVESIQVIDKVVELKDITVFNSETLRFILPEIQIPEGQTVATGRITVKTKYGDIESLVDFTFNPALENVVTSSPGGYENTGTTEVVSESQQENAGASANLQETMLNPPMFVSEKIDNELGTEILTVKIDQNDYVNGPWKIDPQVEYSYILDSIEVGPNNTVTRTRIESSESSYLLGFVSSDGQTFSITRDQFIDAEFSQILEMEKGKRLEISTSIKLRARPEDREKNPKDDTKSVRFRMIVPSTESGVQPEGSLSFIQRSSDVSLPNFQGPLYYNIRIPDGGFVTFRFNCPRCVISKVFVATSANQATPLNITTTNNSDTKYTNVINVNSTERLVLSVVYVNANNNGTFTATSNSFTL